MQIPVIGGLCTLLSPQKGGSQLVPDTHQHSQPPKRNLMKGDFRPEPGIQCNRKTHAIKRFRSNGGKYKRDFPDRVNARFRTRTEAQHFLIQAMPRERFRTGLLSFQALPYYLFPQRRPLTGVYKKDASLIIIRNPKHQAYLEG